MTFVLIAPFPIGCDRWLTMSHTDAFDPVDEMTRGNVTVACRRPGDRPRRCYARLMEGDLELLERWRTGDRQAGEALFARYFAEVCRFFQHKIEDKADDLVQQTFMACVKARNQFRNASSFRTYLFA